MLVNKIQIYVFSVLDYTAEREAIAISTSGYILAYIEYISENNIAYKMGVGNGSRQFYDLYNGFAPHGWDIHFVPRTQLNSHNEAQIALENLVYNRLDLDD